MASLRERLSSVRARVQEAAQHLNKPLPEILAVSKLHPIVLIQEAFSDCGQQAFGENYVKELIDKAGQLPQEIQWHLIGHLQSNKCRALLAVSNLKRVSSVDSEALAKKLNSACEQLSREVEVLIQINASEEGTKSGVLTIEEVNELAGYINHQCPRLRLRGLMAMGHPTDDEKTRAGFTHVANMLTELPHLSECDVLSMGMTDDLELAIKCGSTQVRIGTAIFGARPPKGASRKTQPNAGSEDAE